MDTFHIKPGKLLFTIVSKPGAERALVAIKHGGAKGGTSIAGHGMARYFTGGPCVNEEVSEALIVSIMHEEADDVTQALIKASLEDPEHINGLALVIEATALMRMGSMMENAQSAPYGVGSEKMDTTNTLITCIITHGQADEIMSLAREAGARGGTIVNARGTGTEEDVTFFGISLVPEKEMLLIVAAKDTAQKILEAVGQLPVFNKPGGGIVFTTPVEKLITLGR